MEIRKAVNPPDSHLPGLRPPQFRLRTLLGVIAAVAVFLAAARWTGPVVWGVGLFAVLTVLAHVAGNSIGTQLRRRNGALFRGGDGAERNRSGERPPPSPPSHLHERKSLGRPIQILTIAGALLGASGGCWWMYARYGAQADGVVFLVASAGFGGLGAFLTFLTVSFLQVIGQAIHQADAGGDVRGKR